MPMAVVNARDDLLEESASLVLLEFAMFDDVVEQLAATYVFHNHEDISWSRNNLIEFDDMRVPEQLEVLNFPANLAHDIEALDFLPIQDLDGDLVLGHLMFANFHFPKGSDSERGAE